MMRARRRVVRQEVAIVVSPADAALIQERQYAVNYWADKIRAAQREYDIALDKKKATVRAVKRRSGRV